MKKIFLLLLLSGIGRSYSQMQNAIWMIGYQIAAKDGGIEFTSGVPDTFGFERPMNIQETNAGISSESGNLLFYTNGIYIANNSHDTLLNSVDFNPGYGTEYWGATVQGGGLDYSQMALILPIKNDTNLFHVFSMSYEIVDFPFWWDENPLSLRYSRVDRSLDGGKGGVTEKSTIVLSDTLNTGRLTATRHANGRDWWVICHKYRAPLYYILLVTKDSIYTPLQQNIGDSLIYDAWGQNCFSPDGSKFVNVDPIYQDSIFDYMEFDRCEGKFLNHQDLFTPGCQPQSGAFSSSSRYLYVACTAHLYQWDTWATDIQSSRQLVGHLDIVNAFSLLNNMLLAPDSKIYISGWGGFEYFHVINKPDSSGYLCNYESRGLALPTYNDGSVPNAVNYDLGALIGSACDSLGVGIAESKPDNLIFNISPNPASAEITIESYSWLVNELLITDIFGQIVFSQSIVNKNQFSIDVHTWQPGIYVINLQLKDGSSRSMKFVKQ